MLEFYLYPGVRSVEPDFFFFFFNSKETLFGCSEQFVDMSWTSLGLVLSFGLFLAPLGGSAERQPSRSGIRRLYVLQPGPGPGPGQGPGPGPAGAVEDGGVRVSSISSRHGPAGQPLVYNVELSRFGGQVRTRRMGNQQEQNQQNQLLQLSG